MKEFMKNVWRITGKALIQGLGVVAYAVLFTVYLIVCIVTNTIGLIGALCGLSAVYISGILGIEELEEATDAFGDSIKGLLNKLLN